MTEKKRILNVTVDESIAADVRRTAETEGVSISSVVEEALREHLRWEHIRLRGIAAIEQYYEEHGWPTADEQAEAQAKVDEAHRLLDEARARNEARRQAKRAQQRGNVA
jgi:post-segregation antitoxin (ccd killing protein)